MDTRYKSSQEVASRLDVSPSTLRRWSDEFMEFLSKDASSLSGKAQQRYAEQDIERLLMVKDYMSDGLTYEQVRLQLREEFEIPANSTLITSDDAASSTIIGYISETVENVRQGQLSVLNSQAANRELMGVVIQDNFNLKEENNRLRARMLELERQIGDVRREEVGRREAFRQEVETKLAEIRSSVSQTQQQVMQSQENQGCLGSLLGRRRAQPMPMSNPYPPQSNAAPPRNYPRPPGPPE
jgi:DNA-binding transcriptional MerR regulator